MMLCSVADVAAALGRDIDEDDLQAVSAIERASAVVVAELPDWQWTPAEQVTLSFAGGYGRTLELPARNVTAVSSVEVDGELLDADAWEWSGRRTVKRVDGGSFVSPQTQVRVVVDLGELDVPQILATVAVQLALRLYTNPEGVRQEMLGSYMVMFNPTAGQAGLTNDERRMVRQFRQRAFS
jgi:hypothetical protein